MDIQRLRHAVFEKTGIRIDEVDPVLAIVALNEAVFEDLMTVYRLALTDNNDALDEKIGSLVVLHEKLVEASKNLVERANQAHLSAALRAAADAKSEIMTAARLAVSSELEKASAIVTNAAHQLADASDKVRMAAGTRWSIAIAQAVVSGLVAAVVILSVQHLT